MSRSRKVKRRRKREKARRQRLKRKKQAQGWLQGFRRRLETGLLQGHKVVIEPGRVAKMSKVLEAFVEPYLELVDTEDAYRRLPALAVVAWNASFLAEEEQRDVVDDMTSEVMSAATREEREDSRALVNTLVERKKTYFSEYTRKVIDFELTDTGKDYHLSVVSTMEDAPKRP